MQITESDRVCHPYWLRTQRKARRGNVINYTGSIPSSFNPEQEKSQEDGQPSGSTASESSTNLQANVQTIVLPQYRRAANPPHHCVYPNCDSTTLHGISDNLRATVLSNHKYYLPSLARICSELLLGNHWETLFHSENSIASFVNAFHPSLDFENVQEMEDRIFEYWIDLTKIKFNTLLQEVSRLSQIKRGSLGLAALLLKMRTGDSDERIATLVQSSTAYIPWSL